MSKVKPRDLIVVGRVVRPHGLTGLLRIVSYAQSRETFLQAGSVFLNTDQDDVNEWKVVSIHPHQSCYLLKLLGLDSINQAEAVKGSEILITKDSLDKTSEDEFYWFELIGLNVYLVTGEYLGTLEEILPTGSNDVYVVKDKGREYLIPAIHSIIQEIDLSRKRMIISPVKGLLDLP